jgi:hypothetical protein
MRRSSLHAAASRCGPRRHGSAVRSINYGNATVHVDQCGDTPVSGATSNQANPTRSKTTSGQLDDTAHLGDIDLVGG